MVHIWPLQILLMACPSLTGPSWECQVLQVSLDSSSMLPITWYIGLRRVITHDAHGEYLNTANRVAKVRVRDKVVMHRPYLQPDLVLHGFVTTTGHRNVLHRCPRHGSLTKTQQNVEAPAFPMP